MLDTESTVKLPDLHKMDCNNILEWFLGIIGLVEISAWIMTLHPWTWFGKRQICHVFNKWHAYFFEWSCSVLDRYDGVVILMHFVLKCISSCRNLSISRYVISMFYLRLNSFNISLILWIPNAILIMTKVSTSTFAIFI